ncbi:MAG: OmpA family protein [Candidatus Woesearchaeota archaeon]
MGYIAKGIFNKVIEGISITLLAGFLFVGSVRIFNPDLYFKYKNYMLKLNSDDIEETVVIRDKAPQKTKYRDPVNPNPTLDVLTERYAVERKVIAIPYINSNKKIGIGNTIDDKMLTIRFASGNTLLYANDTADLDNFVDALAYESEVTIEGYSDSNGNAGKNLKLSRTRAESVGDYLARRIDARNRKLLMLDILDVPITIKRVVGKGERNGKPAHNHRVVEITANKPFSYKPKLTDPKKEWQAAKRRVKSGFFSEGDFVKLIESVRTLDDYRKLANLRMHYARKSNGEFSNASPKHYGSAYNSWNLGYGVCDELAILAAPFLFNIPEVVNHEMFMYSIFQFDRKTGKDESHAFLVFQTTNGKWGFVNNLHIVDGRYNSMQEAAGAASIETGYAIKGIKVNGVRQIKPLDDHVLFDDYGSEGHFCPNSYMDLHK